MLNEVSHFDLDVYWPRVSKGLPISHQNSCQRCMLGNKPLLIDKETFRPPPRVLKGPKYARSFRINPPLRLPAEKTFDMLVASFLFSEQLELVLWTSLFIDLKMPFVCQELITWWRFFCVLSLLLVPVYRFSSYSENNAIKISWILLIMLIIMVVSGILDGDMGDKCDRDPWEIFDGSLSVWGLFQKFTTLVWPSAPNWVWEQDHK